MTDLRRAIDDSVRKYLSEEIGAELKTAIGKSITELTLRKVGELEKRVDDRITSAIASMDKGYKGKLESQADDLLNRYARIEKEKLTAFMRDELTAIVRNQAREVLQAADIPAQVSRVLTAPLDQSHFTLTLNVK